ncbi:MAG TPA: tetratricopeptide repeat protein [Sphingobacteriaceae bacterium]
MSWTKHPSLALLAIIISVLQIVASLGGAAPKIALIGAVVVVIGWIIVLTRHHPITSTIVDVTKTIIMGSIFSVIIIIVSSLFIREPQRFITEPSVMQTAIIKTPSTLSAALWPRGRFPEKTNLLEQADKCYNDKNYQCAIEAYTKVMNSTEEGDPDGYFGLCKVYNTQGAYNQAISNCTLAIDGFPRQSFYYGYSHSLEEAYRERAEAYKGAGLADYAIADYLNALEVTNNYNIRQDILYRLSESGKPPPYFIKSVNEDIDKYTEDIKDYPNGYDSHYRRAQKYYIIADYNHALDDYNTCINLYKEQLLTRSQSDEFLAHAYHKRGTVYREMGLKDKAIDDFYTALTVGRSRQIIEIVRKDVQQLGASLPEEVSTSTP